MASVNIGEANQGDAFYRYKMPKLQSRIQGRGNGIKTEVVNNVEIAKALERQPEYILKFYGCELGAQTNYDKKTGTSIVNGAHDTNKLVELLEAFIKKYVQCYDCHNPETMVKIKRENIFLACKACGCVSSVDMKHRLNTFILKNPPEEKLSKAEKKLKKDEKERLKEAAGDNLDKEEKRRKKKEKEAKKLSKKSGSKDSSGSPPADDVSEEEDDDGGIQWMTDTSAAAAKARAEEQLSTAMAGMVTQGNIEAEQEATRKREEKRKAEEEAAQKAQEQAEQKAREEVERRAKEEAERKAKEAAEAAAAESPVEQIKSSLKEDKPDATAKLCDSFDVEKGPAERSSYLMQALVGGVGDGKVELLITTHQAVLKSLAKDKPGQFALLIGAEHTLTACCPSQINQIQRVLKGLYDNDIVTDSIILTWHSNFSVGTSLGVSVEDAKKIRKISQAFIDWLEASDEEDSDDESDEE